VEQFVRSVVAVLLRRDEDSVPADAPFVDLGLDSLAGLQLRRDLLDATGIDLPATLIYDQPTCATVAARLVSESGPDAAPPTAGSLEALVTELEREVTRSRQMLQTRPERT
jgi:acyl carrier protein